MSSRGPAHLQVAVLLPRLFKKLVVDVEAQHVAPLGGARPAWPPFPLSFMRLSLIYFCSSDSGSSGHRLAHKPVQPLARVILFYVQLSHSAPIIAQSARFVNTPRPPCVEPARVTIAGARRRSPGLPLVHIVPESVPGGGAGAASDHRGPLQQPRLRRGDLIGGLLHRLSVYQFYVLPALDAPAELHLVPHVPSGLPPWPSCPSRYKADSRSARSAGSPPASGRRCPAPWA